MKITTMAELLQEERGTIKKIDDAIKNNELNYAAGLLNNFVDVYVYGINNKPGQNSLNFKQTPTLTEIEEARKTALNILLDHFKKIDWSEY